MSAIKIFRDIFEQRNKCQIGNLSIGQLMSTVVAYGNDELPKELQEWVRDLNEVDLRKLYRFCRNYNIMPEAVLERLDRSLEKAETRYRNKQKNKERPHLTPLEKHWDKLQKEIDDIKFFFETREKIKGGMSLREAVSKDETKERYYHIFKTEYDKIDTTDVDAFIETWWKENLL